MNRIFVEIGLQGTTIPVSGINPERVAEEVGEAVGALLREVYASANVTQNDPLAYVQARGDVRIRTVVFSVGALL